jgi:hypothetical protein
LPAEVTTACFGIVRSAPDKFSDMEDGQTAT